MKYNVVICTEFKELQERDKQRIRLGEITKYSVSSTRGISLPAATLLGLLEELRCV
jgi:hypothetical protein